MDASFFTKPALVKKAKTKGRTPTSRAETVTAISGITDLTYSSDDEPAGPDYAQQLLERALHHSFNETGAGDVIDVDTGESSVKSAIKRVNMITDNPGRNMARLTKLRPHKTDALLFPVRR